MRRGLRALLVGLVAGGLTIACAPIADPRGPEPSLTGVQVSEPAARPSTPASTPREVPLSTSPAGPRRVIVLVGDGLGAGAREAARLALTGKDGSLAMDRLRYAGSVRTGSADPDSAVTDSAAAATALATGIRTRNGAVGVDRRGRQRDSLLDLARERGMATGLVTTAEVTDATPAAFGAHVLERSRHREIARQYVRDSEPDVVLGGGGRRWTATLRDRAREGGWTVVTSPAGLGRADGPRILGLFAEGRMFTKGPEGQGRYAPRPTLRAMTAKALDVLAADPDGFFLLVEEEGIDEMAHANNARGTIRATRAFDRAVALVHRFAEDNPGTLVVVLGDHETGGVSVSRERSGSGSDGPFRVRGSELDFWVSWTTTRHTGNPTPLGAEGPGAERLARAQHLADVHAVLRDALRADER